MKLLRTILRSLASVLLASILIMPSTGQSVGSAPYKSQEVSETDGIPVLIKHLPDWEQQRPKTVFTNNSEDLKKALGERPVIDLIDFAPGTEAVTAPYPAGKLLIVEYSSPQGSIDADTKFKAAIDETTAYRRIGNYNVLVFDATDTAAANALMDEVKYEKNVVWLGPNPYQISAERAFVLTTSDIFFSTVEVIVLGIGLSIVCGLLVGFIYFSLRERRRAAMSTYTDAGGMTRLNLDGFTPDILPDKLLGE